MTLTFIALTGGPGGGKTTLIHELLAHPEWRGRVLALPEAITLMHGLGVSPREKRFQRLMVAFQMALEDALRRGWEGAGPRLVLCHRGSLDPLAYWLARGWSAEEFFAYTATTRAAHYARYHAVLHLVTAAEGAVHAYRRYPEAQRGETPAEAVRLDRLLQQVWGGHPRYVRLGNEGRDWAAKSAAAREALEDVWRGKHA
ncbi:MAG: hypothetical protein Fur0043_23480 [Anaerolineales bacterium]